jgi:rhodanese-related sulfurtransferase
MTHAVTPVDVRRELLARREIAILDLREEDPFARGHPLFAANLPLSRLEIEVYERLPRRDVRIVLYDDGEGLTDRAARRLAALGYSEVYALNGGVTAWAAAGFELFRDVNSASKAFGKLVEARGRTQSLLAPEAGLAAREVAYRVGVRRLDPGDLTTLIAETHRTLYRFDPRPAEAFEAGHLPGFRNAPGGRLVQETDHAAPVRGARIVLADPRGVRADMIASWLAQMGWEVYVLDAPDAAFSARGPAPRRSPDPPAAAMIGAPELAGLLDRDEVALIDIGPSPAHRRGHIPGAWFAIRARLTRDLAAIGEERPLALTSPDGILAQFAAPELATLTTRPPRVLEGGTAAWIDAGLPLETGIPRAASAPEDVYQRLHEGPDNTAGAKQADLDWELGLVDQLARDGTHGFYVI